MTISLDIIIEISDTVISITALTSLIITLIKYRHDTEKEFKSKVQKIAKDVIIEFLDSERFRRSIMDVINDSELYRRIDAIDMKLTELLTILCYTDDKLKNTPLCNKINNSK